MTRVPIADLVPDVIGTAGRYGTDAMVMAWRVNGCEAHVDTDGTGEVWYWGKCKPSADRSVLAFFGCLDAPHSERP
jgi:hypothetical protein